MEKLKPLIEARGLTKIFNKKTVVDNIDFSVWPGEIVGFLGPNGAGKTTTIRMLINILAPNSGELRLFGETYERARTFILSQMNASSGTLTMPGKISVEENLKVFGDMYGIPKRDSRIEELLKKFDLTKMRKEPVYALSTGQQVRVSMAKAFLNKPKLLLLDEPTSSLDPDVADRVRSFLLDIVKQEGTTVFLTSHNMLEVEKVCSRVIFLNEGRIQDEGSPKELARRVKRWTLHLKVAGDPKERVVDVDRDAVGPYITELVEKGERIENLSVHEPTLEDFFVSSARKSGNAEERE